MQNDSHDGQYGTSGAHDNDDILPFPSTSTDIFGHPMFAPATGAICDCSRAFLGLGGVDFDILTADIFSPGSQRISSSLDWGRDSQLFQDAVNASSNPRSTNRTKRQRRPRTAFNFKSSKNDGEISGSGEPFSTTISGAVDPGLLFSERNTNSSPRGRPAASHVAQQPYEHQLRESRRDQEELRRSRSTCESSTGRHVDRGAISSPMKGNGRPSLLWRVGDIRGRKGQGFWPLG
jgi:hypothetical protein